jgi:hypothetical protein
MTAGEPILGSAAQQLYDSLWQLAGEDQANDWALAHLCNAIGAMRQRAVDLFEDRDGLPGWSQLFDVERCPAYALAFLGQIAGVTVTAGASEDIQRDEVRAKAGKDRGRPASTVRKVKATLEGTKTVRVIERVGGSAWRHQIITLTAETPDPAATFAAMLSDKPEGDIFEHLVTDDVLIDEGTRSIDTATGTIDTATLADIT